MNVLYAIFAFLSVVPLLLLLSAKSIPEYGAFLSRIARFFPYRTLAPAPVFGVAGGVLAGVLTDLVNSALFPNFELAARPSEALTWTLQIAFLNAGFMEELIKSSVAVALVFALTREKNIKGENENSAPGSVFLAAAPFLCGGVGVGFALFENFFYLRSYADAGLPAMIFTRGLISAPIHTAINFNFGLSLYLARGRDLPRAALAALVVAIFFHGLFDFFALPPVPFAGFLAMVLEVLLVGYVLARMYTILPATRFRAGRFGPATEPEETATANAWELSPGARTFFARGLVRDPHRQVRPLPGQPPFADDEFPFPSPGIRDAFLINSYASPVPEPDREYRAFFENACRQTFAGSPVYVWDSGVFAEFLAQDPALYPGLLALGLDLTRTVPLRVLEIWPSGRWPGAYRYISCGLGPVLGRECLLSFAHPFALARILFMALASGAFAKSPEELVPFPVAPILLGDPRAWFEAILVSPMLDPARETLERSLAGRCPLPHEIFYLNRADLRFVTQYGVQNYFAILKERGLSWFNDFLRPALLTGDEPTRGMTADRETK